jgi:hypothetical protein
MKTIQKFKKLALVALATLFLGISVDDSHGWGEASAGWYAGAYRGGWGAVPLTSLYREIDQGNIETWDDAFHWITWNVDRMQWNGWHPVTVTDVFLAHLGQPSRLEMYWGFIHLVNRVDYETYFAIKHRLEQVAYGWHRTGW